MFSEPAIGERFFGREEILDLLGKRVSALKEGYRQNIAFTGMSLAGKTSILQHFLYTARDEDFIAIYVEISKEPFKIFANKFIATLLYNALTKSGIEPAAEMDSIIEASQKAFPRTCQAARHIISSAEKGEYDEAYTGLLGLTSVLKEEIKMPCIVIFDEFDNLEHLGIKNPFLNFGKVIMVQKDTMYIVTSSRNQSIKRILTEKLSLLFGNFEIVKVGGFGLKSAGDFIDMRLAGFEAEAPIRKFLIAFTEGNPFYLHQLTEGALSAASAKMTNYIDAGVVAEAIVDKIFSAGGAIHQYLLNFILDQVDTRYRNECIAALVAIANGRGKLTEIARALKTRPGEVSKAFARLAELGFVSKNGIFYKIDDSVLAFWLKYVYQRKKDLLIDGIFTRPGRLAGEMSGYIANFTEEMGRNAADRIAELFNLFSNELVPIDSKHTRMPHFTKVELKVFQESGAFITASFRGRTWVIKPYEKEMNENDIIDYVRGVKAAGGKVSNKIIIPLAGMEENARLLAKELKISIWDLATINMLLGLYGKKRFVIL